MTPQQKENRLQDWVAETHESVVARLEGVKAAQTQTRLTLGAMAVISVMMLIASYNAYLSYDYNWIVERNCPKDNPDFKRDIEKDKKTREELSKLVDEEPTKNIEERNKALMDHAMKEWSSSRTVMVSLLGIRVSVDDVSVLGTTVLLVLALWLFLVARRENHTIGFLLRDTDSPGPGGNHWPPNAPPAGRAPTTYPNGERWLIYHTIISNSLFVTFDQMPNVNRLSGPNSLEAAVAKDDRTLLRWIGLKFARGFFFWFPAVVALGVGILDLCSYFRTDPFVFGCEPEGPTPRFLKSLVVFVVCYIPLIVCCWKSSRLATRTERVLRKYGKKLLNHLKQQQRLSKSRD
ncbi:MAG: hypothetical protein JOZ96_16365 [Acidobacteria bacterium]|nr:hypothetical protein [Acidobacteriota bacterium]